MYVILFFVSIIFAVFLLAIVLTRARQRISNTVYDPILMQPYSSGIMSKNSLVGMALLETPIILTVVMILSVYDFLLYESIPFFSFLPFFYISLFACSAAITIYYTAKSISHLMSLFSYHPHYEGKFAMQLLLFISSFQVPFILVFVSLFYHKYSMIMALKKIFMSSDLFVFVFVHLFVLLLGQKILSKGVSEVSLAVSHLYRYYPENSLNILNFILMQIGFLQAPFIFCFISFMILFKVYFFKVKFLYFLFSVVFLAFGIVAYLIIDRSTKVAKESIVQGSYSIEKNKKMLQFSLISQIILDSRILYILLILIFAINFFN
jgi:hypothetical protein